MAETPDRWAAGVAYDLFMGRWSRELARRFVGWLGIAPGARWLDVGCGTGALAEAVCHLADPESVRGCDPAAPLIARARDRLRDPRVTFAAVGVGSLPPHPQQYDCVASLLALNFFPDPEAAVAEMGEGARKGGVVAACVWDYAEGMQFLRYFWDAAIREDPNARTLDEGRRFPLCRRDALVALFSGAGMADVQCVPLETPTTFIDFDDYWSPFLGGTGPGPSYVSTLNEEGRARLAAALEQALPHDRNGGIPLVARAWAVRGTVV